VADGEVAPVQVPALPFQERHKIRARMSGSRRILPGLLPERTVHGHVAGEHD
jgi:hypothetical protein